MATNTTTSANSKLKCINKCKDASSSKSLASRAKDTIKAQVAKAQEAAWAWVENMVDAIWAEIKLITQQFVDAANAIKKLGDASFWRDEIWTFLPVEMVRSVTAMLGWLKDLTIKCNCEAPVT